jgi:hypothetical protein
MSDETQADNKLKESTKNLEDTLEILRIDNRITALQGIVTGGGKLTAEQSAELADLKTRSARLKGQK